MELFSPAFFSALMAIILLDLVLAGDNAIVIGLAVRNVPVEVQQRVILWGTAGAIAVRVLLTLVVASLLKISGFLVLGGLTLVWIAWTSTKEPEGGHTIDGRTIVRAAFQTIVVAGMATSVDNVLSVGGAAQGSMLLVVIGLLISIPIVVWGSKLVLQLINRFPVIIVLGAGVLGWTAARMIATESLIKAWFEQHHWARLALYGVIVGGVTLPAMWPKKGPSRMGERVNRRCRDLIWAVPACSAARRKSALEPIREQDGPAL
ncbi:MAG: TerC family protein [Burkholderiaceae bacterium]|nr:TerC family protein [Burkholderiaceae bacterium]MDH3459814.1 TerC family protein [Burkholderiaceae bacterium]